MNDRVGVWSLYRFGDPDATPEAFRRCLLRTLKLASHETGHMFSMLHCTEYECNMSGTNSLEETDRRPLDACPECVAKVCWLTNCDPRIRYERLRDFARDNSLDEAQFFDASLRALNR